MVSVAQLVGDPELDLPVLHAADLDLLVSWIATSELADPAPFFKGGEVLLTTGLQTAGWRREWSGYVQSLVEAGVVGIGIGTGLTYRHPPPALVDVCRRHGMNLFEVPRATAFVTVSHRLSELLAADSDEDARAALRDQRALTAAALKPDPAAQVLRTLAKAIGGACLLGPDGDVVVGPVGPHTVGLSAADIAEDVVRLRKSGTRTSSSHSGPTGTTLIQPVGVNDRRPGYLAVAGPPQLSDGQRGTIAAAVALLSLIAEQQRTSTQTLRGLRARAIELLLTDHVDAAQLILGEVLLPKQFQILRAQGSGDDIEEALSALERRHILAAEHGGELCGVVSTGDASAAGARLAAIGMRVGLGRAVSGDEAADGYRTAGLAVDRAQSGSVARWDRIVAHGPLGLIDPAAATAFATTLLGDLDARQRDLLRRFLNHHGSTLKVAEELGVHRNTVRNRLGAIEAVLGGSLDDPQYRVNAWIALQSLTDD